MFSSTICPIISSSLLSINIIVLSDNNVLVLSVQKCFHANLSNDVLVVSVQKCFHANLSNDVLVLSVQFLFQFLNQDNVICESIVWYKVTHKGCDFSEDLKLIKSSEFENGSFITLFDPSIDYLVYRSLTTHRL